MLRVLPKLLLVATAFAPVLVTQAIVSWHNGEQGLAVFLVCLAGALTWWCINIIQRCARELASHPVSVSEIKPADKEVLGFVIAYLLPLARGSNFEWFPFAVVLAVFLLMIMTSNAYHTNPLLGLLGYRFYEVKVDSVVYILISKRHLHNTKGVKKVVSITDYMLLDVKQENHESSSVNDK